MNKLDINNISESNELHPVYSSESAAGADLKANIENDITLKPGNIYMVPTGIKIELPNGYEAQIRPRSGLAAKYGIGIVNSPGTIDSDYRGEIKIILINLGKNDFIIKKYDRIAQMIIAPVIQGNFIQVKQLNNSQRGTGGFGSTGLN